MRVYYLDTSALLKRYKSEQGTEVVNDLFTNKLQDDVLITSYFSALEVEAAVARALKGRILSRASYRAIIGRFAQELGESLLVQPISNTIVAESIGHARRYALRAADAIHLSTAMRLSQAAMEPAVFVTSDKELLLTAQAEGLQEMDPQEANAGALLKQHRSES